ncbi:MAG: biotin transporter BioY [Calditrichota bacterium]
MTLVDYYAPSRTHSVGRWLYSIIAIAFGNALIALSAQISIMLPFSPVPITGQTFGVLLVAAALGRVRGTIAVASYLLEGASGLPVFASGAAGAMYLFGPTGGYLFAFIPAAWLTGYLAERGWTMRWLSTALTMLLGSAVILTIGTLVLSLFVGNSQAMMMGFVPFIVGDVVKIAAATLVLPSAHKLLQRGNQSDR